MEYPVVHAKPRDLTGKGVARKLRALGYIPAVFYGPDTTAQPLVVDPKEVASAIRGAKGPNPVVTLEIDHKPHIAVVRNYEVHPVKRTLLHCDFFGVSEGTVLTVEVPLKIVGKSEGEKAGARLSVPVRRVRVKCKVSDIPPAIELDVTPLKIGQAVMLSQVPAPPGVKIVVPKDVPVVLVRMGRAAKEGTGAEEAEGSKEAKS